MKCSKVLNCLPMVHAMDGLIDGIYLFILKLMSLNISNLQKVVKNNKNKLV